MATIPRPVVAPSAGVRWIPVHRNPPRLSAVVASANKTGNISTSKSGLMKQSKAWLKSELESRKLPSGGNKAKLAERLSMSLVTQEGEALSSATALELSSATTKTTLLKLRKAQLIYELSNRGLATAGRKEALVLRLLNALRSPEVSEELNEAAEAEAEITRRLGQRLLYLDESVKAIKERVAGAEESRDSATAKEILAQLSELQAEAEADQAEVEELQVLEVFFMEGKEELVPEMQRRKSETIDRLMKLKAGITASEAQAVALRSKLRIVEQAKLFGVDNIELEEDEEIQEEKELVSASMASSTLASSAGVTSLPSAPPFVQISSSSSSSSSRTSSSVTALSAASGVAEATSYGDGNGPGRTQIATARSPVQVPAPSEPSQAATPPAAASTASAAVPTSAASSGSDGWSKGPEAVGVVIAFAVLTVVDGIRFALK